MIGLGLKFLANCRPEQWRTNTEAVLKLALLSMATLDLLEAAEKLSFDRNKPGLIKLFRDPLSMKSAMQAAALYRELGVPLQSLDPAGCIAVEPALGPIRESISGGIHYPEDGSGDALLFTQALAGRAQGAGVEFMFDHRIERLERDGDRIAGVATDRGRIAGDHYVLALGSYSTPVARSIGFALPVYPAKGYSITVQAPGWNEAPRIPIADDGRKVAVVPLGSALRVAGTVEFTGFDTRLNEARGRMLVEGLAGVYPNYPKNGKVTHWSGLRPLTPDGRPIIGGTPFRNLSLNTGHGPLGWTLAAGSGLALAELVSGKTPSIDLKPFALAR
jgi:D-amino-acid dehydrogenase